MMIPAFSESCPAYAGLFFCADRMRHANFQRETMDLCRFSGVEADFALNFPMLRIARKLAHNIDAWAENIYII